MKISAIGLGINITNKLRNNSYNNQIYFGVGEDYGNDEFLVPYDYGHKEGNVGKFFAALVKFPIHLVRERLTTNENPLNSWDDEDPDSSASNTEHPDEEDEGNY